MSSQGYVFQMISKWKEFKEKLKNPRPEVLFKIEYKSYLLGAIGTFLTCAILVALGYWYVIFAFIFNLGISYSAGMRAYKKYKNLIQFMPKENPKDFIGDISPSRRRSKIIEFVFGRWIRTFSIVLSILISGWILLKPILKAQIFGRILLSMPFTILTFGIFVFFYFFIVYKLAYPIYRRKVQDV